MSESALNAPMNLSNDGSLDWMRQIQTQQRRCEEENGVLRNLYKRAKSSGENIKAMRAAIRATKLDPSEVVNDLRHEIRYMALRRIPVTAEELLAGWDAEVTGKTAREDDMWDAGERGYKDGRAGMKIEDAPYEPGTELYVSWYADWQKGQASIARELGPDAQPADASRERPRRSKQLKLVDDTGSEVVEKSTRVAKPGKKLGRPKGSTNRPKGANGTRKARRTGPTQDEDGTQIY